jgi:hypothetical protein
MHQSSVTKPLYNNNNNPSAYNSKDSNDDAPSVTISLKDRIARLGLDNKPAEYSSGSSLMKPSYSTGSLGRNSGLNVRNSTSYNNNNNNNNNLVPVKSGLVRSNSDNYSQSTFPNRNVTQSTSQQSAHSPSYPSGTPYQQYSNTRTENPTPSQQTPFSSEKSKKKPPPPPPSRPSALAAKAYNARNNALLAIMKEEDDSEPSDEEGADEAPAPLRPPRPPSTFSRNQPNQNMYTPPETYVSGSSESWSNASKTSDISPSMEHSPAAVNSPNLSPSSPLESRQSESSFLSTPQALLSPASSENSIVSMSETQAMGESAMKRERVLEELLETEKTYITDLHSISKVRTKRGLFFFAKRGLCSLDNYRFISSLVLKLAFSHPMISKSFFQILNPSFHCPLPSCLI